MNPKTCVLDASVVAAAFFGETYSRKAGELLAGGGALFAPDLIYAELANVIWKRQARREIVPDEAMELLDDIGGLPLQITPCASLAGAALELAIRTGRSAYDCLYLALAVATEALLVTADRKFANALARTPLAKQIAWIGDLD